MLSILRTSLARLPAFLPKCGVLNQNVSFFHILSKPSIPNPISTNIEPRLLVPVTPNIVPSCGFKVKGKLRKRCKDCYFVMRQQRLYVICKTHPRHKQMSMIPKEKNTWILSAATQGKVRPW